MDACSKCAQLIRNLTHTPDIIARGKGFKCSDCTNTYQVIRHSPDGKQIRNVWACTKINLVVA